ncbi:MAG: Radical domain protein [Gemmatimonadetes bacterium]|jgi:DNA repair photolyase|nr:Radical domain protein [Gemmatimonadota bacterium]
MRIQHTLFDAPPPQPLVSLGEQSDIRYYATEPRSILNSPAVTGMGFWSINPYVGCAFGCAYCYARFAHRYSAERIVASERGPRGFSTDVGDMPPWLAFERRILVKREAGEIVRRELRRPARAEALLRERVVIGTATDPYQPAERRFRVTRGVLEVLAEQRGLGVTIITKSPLVTRDLDLLVRIAERSALSVHVSLITVDRELARRLEPRAPTPEARLRGIARLRARGIEVGVNCMPVLPGITDAPGQIEALVAAVAEAKASYLGACALRLRSTARQRYLPFIEAEFPQLAARYRSAYARGHQVGEKYREGLRERFGVVCRRHGVTFDRYYRVEDDDAEVPTPAPVPPQLALAL